MEKKQDKWKKLLATKIDFWSRSARISRLKKKTNTIVRNLLNVTTNVIMKIDEKWCRCYGHVKRMENDRLPKLLMNWQPEGRNRRRCLKKRWSDNLNEGLERCYLRDIGAEDRE